MKSYLRQDNQVLFFFNPPESKDRKENKKQMRKAKHKRHTMQEDRGRGLLLLRAPIITAEDEAD